MAIGIDSDIRKSFGENIVKIKSELEMSDEKLEKEILYKFARRKKPVQNVLPYHTQNKYYGELAMELNQRYISIIEGLVGSGDLIESEDGYELSKGKRVEIESSNAYMIRKQVEGFIPTEVP